VNLPRLSNTTLGTLPGGIVRPAYDRGAVTPGIVHLGVGAFHRAHQAVVVDDRLAAGETGWGIIAASLRSADTRDALAAQDGLYTLAVRDGDETKLRIIGAISEVIVAREARDALLRSMVDPRVRIVTLTITEKGYCRSASTGLLDPDHADIRHDLAHPNAPVSAPGLIVEALRLRRAAGTAPFTVLCCDNLPANGRTVSRVLGDLASLRDPEMGRWLEAELACPSTMVDRIVPATTDADRASVAAALGLADAWPVMTEPFSQWVIEDTFGAGRPRFEDAGVELVADVGPHEKLKLRLLNGTHSTMAYLGQLAGLETIADVIRVPDCHRLVRGLMDHELGPTVPGFTPAQIDAYKAALIARYHNTALRHRTAQIAMDGSQKIPQRLLNTARERLEAGQPIVRIGVALAGFCRFMTGTGENGSALPVNDPLSVRFAEASRSAGADGVARVGNDAEAAALSARLTDAMLAIRDCFGEVGQDPRLAAAIRQPLASLYRHGTLATLAALT
jgi:fructuronate reductase